MFSGTEKCKIWAFCKAFKQMILTYVLTFMNISQYPPAFFTTMNMQPTATVEFVSGKNLEIIEIQRFFHNQL